jgi:hypothetical protein
MLIDAAPCSARNFQKEKYRLVRFSIAIEQGIRAEVNIQRRCILSLSQQVCLRNLAHASPH